MGASTTAFLAIDTSFLGAFKSKHRGPVPIYSFHEHGRTANTLPLGLRLPHWWWKRQAGGDCATRCVAVSHIFLTWEIGSRK